MSQIITFFLYFSFVVTKEYITTTCYVKAKLVEKTGLEAARQLLRAKKMSQLQAMVCGVCFMYSSKRHAT